MLYLKHDKRDVIPKNNRLPFSTGEVSSLEDLDPVDIEVGFLECRWVIANPV